MKWKLLSCVCVLSIFSLAYSSSCYSETTSSNTSEEVDWKKEALECRVKLTATQVELRQYIEENNVLQQWKKMIDKQEMKKNLAQPQSELKEYLKELKEQEKGKEETKPEEE
jgi:hypothetical protein